MAGFAVLALVLAATEKGPSGPGGASSPTVAQICPTAHLTLAMSPNRVSAGGRTVTSLLRVTNTGTTCALRGDAPLLQPVRGPHRVAVGRPTLSDDVARPSVTLKKGQSAWSSISVESLPPTLFRTCRVTSVTGLIITDGVPVGTTRYVAHVFRGVCSNPLRENIGAAWYVAANPDGA